MSIKLFSSIYEIHHFTASQTTRPLPDPPPQINFTAVSGDRVVLPCPIQPGALILYYSVKWYKETSLLAQGAGREFDSIVEDSRYNIDRANYSLIIDPVNINDTSTYYKCQVFVKNPITLLKRQLQLHLIPSLNLSLQVISKYYAQY